DRGIHHDQSQRNMNCDLLPRPPHMRCRMGLASPSAGRSPVSTLCVVVPTVRERCLLDFLDAWSGELASHTLLVIEDNPERSFPIDRPNVRHFSWKEIDAELGDRSWIISRRTDGVRSFGFWK